MALDIGRKQGVVQRLDGRTHLLESQEISLPTRVRFSLLMPPSSWICSSVQEFGREGKIKPD
jgi:hypothetical protein